MKILSVQLAGEKEGKKKNPLDREQRDLEIGDEANEHLVVETFGCDVKKLELPFFELAFDVHHLVCREGRIHRRGGDVQPLEGVDLILSVPRNGINAVHQEVHKIVATYFHQRNERRNHERKTWEH